MLFRSAEPWASEAGIVHNFLPMLDGGFDVALPAASSGEPALTDTLASIWGRGSYFAPKPPTE